MGNLNSSRSEPLSMSSSRQWVVNGFIVTLLGLIVFSIISQLEFWPICNYPMFDVVQLHPEQNTIEFYTVVGREQEERVWRNSPIDCLRPDYALLAILILHQNGWPSAQSREAIRSVIEEMRKKCETRDPAWAGPVTLRIYLVNHVYPATGEVRRVITGRTLLKELTEPGP